MQARFDMSGKTLLQGPLDHLLHNFGVAWVHEVMLRRTVGWIDGLNARIIDFTLHYFNLTSPGKLLLGLVGTGAAGSAKVIRVFSTSRAPSIFQLLAMLLWASPAVDIPFR